MSKDTESLGQLPRMWPYPCSESCKGEGSDGNEPTLLLIGRVLGHPGFAHLPSCFHYKAGGGGAHHSEAQPLPSLIPGAGHSQVWPLPALIPQSCTTRASQAPLPWVPSTLGRRWPQSSCRPPGDKVEGSVKRKSEKTQTPPRPQGTL